MILDAPAKVAEARRLKEIEKKQAVEQAEVNTKIEQLKAGDWVRATPGQLGALIDAAGDVESSGVGAVPGAATTGVDIPKKNVSFGGTVGSIPLDEKGLKNQQAVGVKPGVTRWEQASLGQLKDLLWADQNNEDIVSSLDNKPDVVAEPVVEDTQVLNVGTADTVNVPRNFEGEPTKVGKKNIENQSNNLIDQGSTHLDFVDNKSRGLKRDIAMYGQGGSRDWQSKLPQAMSVEEKEYVQILSKNNQIVKLKKGWT